MAYSEPTGVPLHPRRALGRRPIVLAQLPHVGRATTPAPPPIGNDQAARRTSSNPQTTYFVDGGHTHHRSAPTEHRTRDASLLRSAPARSAPVNSAGPSATLFQLHAQVAPYAGLIVAMALIACAGLLYWIISGPPAAPLDYRDIYNIGRHGFGAQSLDYPGPTSHEPAPTSLASIAATDAAAADEWDFEPWAVEMPPAEELVPELLFPQTANPSAFDFSLLGEDKTTSAAAPDLSTEVARRTVPQPLTPTISR